MAGMDPPGAESDFVWCGKAYPYSSRNPFLGHLHPQEKTVKKEKKSNSWILGPAGARSDVDGEDTADTE